MTTNASLFEQLVSLFGKKTDDPDVQAFLGQYPDHKIGKPADGSQYVVFLSLGFDLLFRPPTGPQPGPSRHLRVLHTIFLFRQDEEKHRAFADLPFGLSFTDYHDSLVSRLGPPYRDSSSVGIETLAWAKWRIGDLSLHANYDWRAGSTRVYSFSRHAV